MQTSTSISASSFRSYFELYYAAKINLTKYLTEQAALKATWTGVTSRPLSLSDLDAIAAAKVGLKGIRAYIKVSAATSSVPKPSVSIGATSSGSALSTWYGTKLTVAM
jgi:hypothetical protein